ncbi:hypothetical protein L249_1127 [Ophiocordyceps polyrhachis-furcata BCC 54312]|uniref:Uncharacterized protein n=1 Tax=Ophiocordyceps polyrhachis-furcata BCC 54312 TaxID=1330021 RepID=A0A367LDA4_9HYPO|nr:hypothetical protein L249_1127 [Ophiocordyceps polyrhachis-furcata BCC 54312]
MAPPGEDSHPPFRFNPRPAAEASLRAEESARKMDEENLSLPRQAAGERMAVWQAQTHKPIRNGGEPALVRESLIDLGHGIGYHCGGGSRPDVLVRRVNGTSTAVGSAPRLLRISGQLTLPLFSSDPSATPIHNSIKACIKPVSTIDHPSPTRVYATPQTPSQHQGQGFPPLPLSFIQASAFLSPQLTSIINMLLCLLKYTNHSNNNHEPPRLPISSDHRGPPNTNLSTMLPPASARHGTPPAAMSGRASSLVEKKKASGEEERKIHPPAEPHMDESRIKRPQHGTARPGARRRHRAEKGPFASSFDRGAVSNHHRYFVITNLFPSCVTSIIVITIHHQFFPLIPTPSHPWKSTAPRLPPAAILTRRHQAEHDPEFRLSVLADPDPAATPSPGRLPMTTTAAGPLRLDPHICIVNAPVLGLVHRYAAVTDPVSTFCVNNLIDAEAPRIVSIPRSCWHAASVGSAFSHQGLSFRVDALQGRGERANESSLSLLGLICLLTISLSLSACLLKRLQRLCPTSHPEERKENHVIPCCTLRIKHFVHPAVPGRTPLSKMRLGTIHRKYVIDFASASTSFQKQRRRLAQPPTGSNPPLATSRRAARHRLEGKEIHGTTASSVLGTLSELPAPYISLYPVLSSSPFHAHLFVDCPALPSIAQYITTLAGLAIGPCVKGLPGSRLVPSTQAK